MVTAQNSDGDFERLKKAIVSLPDFVEKKTQEEFAFVYVTQKMSIRDAIFSKSEEIPIEEAKGKICGVPTVSCPPAIPIVVSGEEITEEHIELLKRYGKDKIKVVSC
jgi:arginine/lysine/ornithine decarboxylase